VPIMVYKTSFASVQNGSLKQQFQQSNIQLIFSNKCVPT